MNEELIKNLRELISMWQETAFMNGDDGMGHIRNDCANDLEEILNGDLSCIERIDYT